MSKTPENPPPSEDEYDRFKELARKLVSVPKQEADESKAEREPKPRGKKTKKPAA